MTFPQQIARYFGTAPRIHARAFVAPGATIVGDVTLEDSASVWFQAVLRADINRIVIGPRSNIQDGAIVHLDANTGRVTGRRSGRTVIVAASEGAESASVPVTVR